MSNIQISLLFMLLAGVCLGFTLGRASKKSSIVNNFVPAKTPHHPPARGLVPPMPDDDPCECPLVHVGLNAAHHALMDRYTCGCPACARWRSKRRA